MQKPQIDMVCGKTSMTHNAFSEYLDLSSARPPGSEGFRVRLKYICVGGDKTFKVQDPFVSNVSIKILGVFPWVHITLLSRPSRSHSSF